MPTLSIFNYLLIIIKYSDSVGHQFTFRTGLKRECASPKHNWVHTQTHTHTGQRTVMDLIHFNAVLLLYDSSSAAVSLHTDPDSFIGPPAVSHYHHSPLLSTFTICFISFFLFHFPLSLWMPYQSTIYGVCWYTAGAWLHFRVWWEGWKQPSSSSFDRQIRATLSPGVPEGDGWPWLGGWMGRVCVCLRGQEVSVRSAALKRVQSTPHSR